MGRWAMLGMVAVFLTACGGDEQVCTPLFSTGRRCGGGQVGTLRCNREGTAEVCDATRECTMEAPCSGALTCVDYGDSTSPTLGRAVCTTPCRTSADCTGSRTCCTYSNSGGSGCVVPNSLATCIR